ncbi:synaptonemal complex protein 1 isoform X8 [Taeniopygia guttata]|uniref:synaptonemal complex protein 1 isoform X8 n=1 Tax=Taeniopygia guttata TaxID=59729 RepID=UPI003BB954B6
MAPRWSRCPAAAAPSGRAERPARSARRRPRAEGPLRFPPSAPALSGCRRCGPPALFTGAMEKENRFKLFMPPRLSAGQVSAGRSQGFNKCSDDDFKLPFDMSNRGEITDSDTISQQVKLCSEVDEENTETMNELFSKLYKEAEKIKQWKLTVESELDEKERKLQEDKKIIEAQNKTIQELQFENEKLHLKLEDEICENKDLLKEAAASRHLCNLLRETCTHFTEKTSKYEQEKEETMQLYGELHRNIERMTVAFEELRVQAENDRLEMSFKLKEEAEKVDKFEKECKLEVSQKEKQISALITQSDEKDGVIKDIKAQLQTSQNKIADLIEAKLHEEEMLKESQVSQEHLKAELEEAKISLQKAEVTQKNLETEFQTTVKTLIQVTREKEEKEEECKKMKALLATLTEEFETSTANLKSLLQKEQNRLKKYEDDSKLLALELQNKSAELEEMTKVKCDKEVQLEELSETLMNNLKKQVENKTKCIEELQQENKVLKKKITAESKKTNSYEGKVNKLQLEIENMNKQHKEAVDIYQKDIETRKINENKLREEIEKMRLLYDETAMIQRETDVRCQHKIAEMVALMEKHKNEYDKMVEEKDAELKVYKMKQQKQLSSERALENELSRLNSELSSLKEQLKAEREEKEKLVKEHSRNMIPESEKKHKTYIIKTPPIDKMQSGRSTNLPSEQSTRKKQKVLLQLDTESDSSEHTDLLSIVSEEEMFKKLYDYYPQASQLHSTAPKKTPAPSNVNSPGSALKLRTMRRIREAGWTAVSKMDRKRKIKDVVKLFA